LPRADDKGKPGTENLTSNYFTDAQARGGHPRVRPL